MDMEDDHYIANAKNAHIGTSAFRNEILAEIRGLLAAPRPFSKNPCWDSRFLKIIAGILAAFCFSLATPLAGPSLVPSLR